MRVFGLIVTALLLSSCGGGKSEPELPIAQQYPGLWMESADMSITMALSKANASGCGEFYFKDSISNPREALVYCTSDGKRWTTWAVIRSRSDPRNSTAVGPFNPEPTIPPPYQ